MAIAAARDIAEILYIDEVIVRVINKNGIVSAAMIKNIHNLLSYHLVYIICQTIADKVPITAPVNTSVGKCTPRYKRESITQSTISVQTITTHAFFLNFAAMQPKNELLEAECPLGNDWSRCKSFVETKGVSISTFSTVPFTKGLSLLIALLSTVHSALDDKIVKSICSPIDLLTQRKTIAIISTINVSSPKKVKIANNTFKNPHLIPSKACKIAASILDSVVLVALLC